MSQRARSATVASYLLLCMLIGGSSQGVWRNLILQLLGIALIAWAAARPQPASSESDRPRFLYLLLAGAALVILIQLVPLPPGLWAELPGRENIAASHRELGGHLQALPLSMAPYASVLTLFAAIPALAMFVAVKMLRPSPRLLAFAIAAGMACSIALGALQVASGPRSWAYLYDITNPGAVGLFANRNHMGTLLLASIPFAVALLVSVRGDKAGSRQGRVAIGIATLMLVVIGIALNGSLAAIGLALPVFVASAALVPLAARWRRIALPLAAVTLVGAVAVLATAPIGGTVTGGPATAYTQSRASIWATTSEAIGDTFPIGSGLGTFEQAYRQYEDPAKTTSSYVNHAHNDYLELALELGAAGIVLMALFLAWWAMTAIRVWTSPLSTPFGRAATIASAAILAHSVVDYPLRTGAISAIFAVALALMVQRLASAPAKGSEAKPTRHVELG